MWALVTVLAGVLGSGSPAATILAMRGVLLENVRAGLARRVSGVAPLAHRTRISVFCRLLNDRDSAVRRIRREVSRLSVKAGISEHGDAGSWRYDGSVSTMLVDCGGTVSEPLEKPHRGVNYSRIPATGFPGLVLALGVMWMFWGGAPEYRPIVEIAGAAGALGGVALIVWRTRHVRGAEGEVLHLRDRPESDAGKR
jgi:hypothetical protein